MHTPAHLQRRGLRTSLPAREGQEAEPEKNAGEQRIMQILSDKFNPSQLEVADTSGGCGAFYSIFISSKQFKDISTIKAHRMVNEELKDIISGIHGLQVCLATEPFCVNQDFSYIADGFDSSVTAQDNSRRLKRAVQVCEAINGRCWLEIQYVVALCAANMWGILMRGV
ncbi:bola-like protein [Tilletiaria anomala UBC 951]|uniref:Bola-like protein n=1 Tax=Tilletiaria anomala (strain ATCC 24038 / CBS 436.72 / UBC 951) TaxID=1037660 RepID=A0A066V964_TILAU|nr:bola-like protein [Tilletiaria anomala UBC 951]KDN38277.1 bola-like protein [Tilletiaria anomala UBC 951]